MARSSVTRPDPFAALYLTGDGDSLTTQTVEAGQFPDVSDLTAFTVELWFKADSPMAANTFISGVGVQWALSLAGSSGLLTWTIFDSGGTPTHLNTSTGALTAGQWAHIVGVLNAGTMTVYVDGAIAGTTSFSGTVQNPASGVLTIGSGSSSSVSIYYWDEVAIYRTALSADRIAAHYAAGVARGFARGQAAGERVGAVLDAAGPNHAPRDIDTGVRTIAGRYMTGQDPLGELRVAETAEAVDAVLFISREGKVKFLDSAHRASAPYDSPVITLADDGTGDTGYFDIAVDYSDSYLANEWNVTRTGGTTQTASDDASIARYLKRPQSLSDLAVTDDSDASDIADDMLAKYKEPFLRVTSVSPDTSDPAALVKILKRDVGDRVRIIRNPRSGGDPIDTEVFIQGISITRPRMTRSRA